MNAFFNLKNDHGMCEYYGHTSNGTLYRSTDGERTWSNVYRINISAATEGATFPKGTVIKIYGVKGD